ncbi:rod shape-determining protein MreC [Nocardioides salsibiostraticola]
MPPVTQRRWQRSGPGQGRPSRGLVLALVLACATMVTLDLNDGTESALDPARRGLGEVLGPLESGASTVVSPVASIPEWFRTQGGLRADVDALADENAQLRRDLRSTGYDRNRLEEYDGLTSAANQLGYAMVPARVVGLGPSQSFSSTVLIDAGSRAGLRPDMTVINNDGLVGRVLRVTSDTATVVLIIDPESTVGGRVGESMDVGMLHGRGVLGDTGRLDLELLDVADAPGRGESVLTWGSQDGAPYLAGVPVGSVTKVYSSLRESAQRAEIKPYVDFGSLDLVGVIVPSGTTSDRAVIEADGSIR